MLPKAKNYAIHEPQKLSLFCTFLFYISYKLYFSQFAVIYESVKCTFSNSSNSSNSSRPAARASDVTTFSYETPQPNFFSIADGLIIFSADIRISRIYADNRKFG